ncbi:hypothetical protein FisN_21Hh140 [Fistulifera solaris]|uniref:Protein kinase domain-containing protein n=1 Tax=Fistulifera solaris TaxID=1519565 RepID=A0A1Z5JRW2_FISSO|nr:hypothetical protein FisN_21Hh140 [Fistulifera solaris]|eukprot:GAX16699.1 hypothetical protein FisN_21Hh140 [Fistulifera solaris]
MDVNPTFGPQELLETLSQSSTKSGNSTKSPGQHRDVSPRSRQRQRHQRSHVDEAYRRVGQKLSLQAHGGQINLPETVSSIRASLNSSFVQYKGQLSHSLSGSPRYRKVPKTTYKDHGEHQPTEGNIVRNLTINAKDSFREWEEQQRQAFAQLDLGSEPSHGSYNRKNRISTEEMLKAAASSHGSGAQQSTAGTHLHGNKGLLSAVLEGASDSATTQTGERTMQSQSHNSASISTKSHSTFDTGCQTASTGPPRGKCLTKPSEPVANEGRDNAEGNLLVYENDVIKIQRKQMHAFAGAMDHKMVDFTVHSLLGQGTFAQVFKCWHKATQQWVALKIVRNRPDYTRQATVEIDVFRELDKNTSSKGSRVELLGFFMYHGHLCLLFELLGPNLYEILKKRQFRGLPLTAVRQILLQTIRCVRDISQKNIVHCDIKPENVLLVSEAAANELVLLGEGRARPAEKSTLNQSNSIPNDNTKDREFSTDVAQSRSSSDKSCATGTTAAHRNTETLLPSDDEANDECTKVKLIDFGSACFEGYTAHTYIQSRFYRSPEVLIGVPYDSVIDMWSLGCVAAELFLGLPILPGIHEHDQLGRIVEMIGSLPDWMLDQGSKATKYFVKYLPKDRTNSPIIPQWRLKTQKEYISSLSHAEVEKKGGLTRLEQQPGNRYFRRTRLTDILFLHGRSTVGKDKDLLPAFVHFLYGLLDPDPWKRLTAFQAAQHPFLTDDLDKLIQYQPAKDNDIREESQANRELGVRWETPWDPSICRRKLLNVQKMREKQQSMRRSSSRNSGSALGDIPKQRSPTDSQVPTPSTVTEETDSHHGDWRQAFYQASTPPQHVATSFNSNRNSSGMIAATTSFNGESKYRAQRPRVARVEAGSGVIGGATGLSQRQTHLPNVAGPSSYSRTMDLSSSNSRPGADFAYALQRPGNVPGLDTASISSKSIWGSSVTGTTAASTQQQSSTFAGNPSAQSVNSGGVQYVQRNTLPGGQVSFPGQHASSVPGHFAPLHRSHDPHANLGDSSSAFGYNGPQSYYSNDSVASSVTMEVDQGMAFLNLPQIHPIQQQQLLQQLLLQQQQVKTMAYAVPQQQVYLATAPDGSFYYVTTSATGQPLLLQPMAVLDPSQNFHGPIPHPAPTSSGIDYPYSHDTSNNTSQNRSRRAPKPNRRYYDRTGSSM